MTTMQQVTAPAVSGKRLSSIDVLRGFTLAVMILVNTAGEWDHAYWPLKHSVWNGCTPTDLVFPTFLFLTGTSLVFSFRSRLARGVGKRELLLHTLQRSVILFLIGVVLNGLPFFPLSTLRIYGVLQRIALCYLCASALYLWNRKPAFLLSVTALLLVGYWVMMRWIPLPGGMLPVRDLPILDPDRNWVAIIDRWMLPGRLYEGTRDPEGLLSTLPAIATVLLGVLTGLWLQTQRTIQEKSRWMLIAGTALIAGGEMWNIWFPINKKLWTSSYVLFAAGIALVALALCTWLIKDDGTAGRWSYPWRVFGTNAITAYVISEVLAIIIYVVHVPGSRPPITLKGYIFTHFFVSVFPPGMDSLLFAIAFVAVCFVPVWILYRRRIFIKI
jgi:predicted acyltransferase